LVAPLAPYSSDAAGRGSERFAIALGEAAWQAEKMAQIKTSSWFTKLPADHCRIGISRGVPLKETARQLYKRLAPGPWFKSCATPEEYAERYFDELLGRLDPKSVVGELEAMAGGGIPTLLCWEHPPPICKVKHLVEGGVEQARRRRLTWAQPATPSPELSSTSAFRSYLSEAEQRLASGT
jgi:hypothetical protein